MQISQLPDFQKQLIKFTLIGMLAVLVDLACYYCFLPLFPEKIIVFFTNEMLAKTCSFICGSVVTYNLNKFWTWKMNDRSNKRFAKFFVLYLFSLLINVSSNSGALYVLHTTSFSNLPYKYLIAFVFATGTSALFNFFGQKWWVFKDASLQ